MKKNSLLFISSILLIMALMSCNKNQSKTEETKECGILKSEFEKSGHSYLMNCMKGCFRVAFINASNKTDKEKFKSQCEDVCRDGIPYEQINIFKKYLDEAFQCNFDYSKKLGNQPTKKDIN